MNSRKSIGSELSSSSSSSSSANSRSIDLPSADFEHRIEGKTIAESDDDVIEEEEETNSREIKRTIDGLLDQKTIVETSKTTTTTAILSNNNASNRNINNDLSSLSILNYKSLDDDEDEEDFVLKSPRLLGSTRHKRGGVAGIVGACDEDDLDNEQTARDDDDYNIDLDYENYFKFGDESQTSQRDGVVGTHTAADHTLNQTSVSSRSARSRSSVGAGSSSTTATTTTTTTTGCGAGGTEDLSSSSSSPNASKLVSQSTCAKPSVASAKPATRRVSSKKSTGNNRFNLIEQDSANSGVNGVPTNIGGRSIVDINKHKYLVGLNLFNRFNIFFLLFYFNSFFIDSFVFAVFKRKPERGINYLIEEKFLERNPRFIAEFLFNRNCVSKQMIGEYISNTQDKLIRAVLK